MSTSNRIAPAHRLVVMIAIAAFVGCASHDVPSTRDTVDVISAAKAAAARGERVPGAPAADTSARPGAGLAYRGTWTPTIAYRDSLFTIERPDSSTVEAQPADSASGRMHRLVVLGRLPECRWSCTVSVELWPDSTGLGSTGMVRALTARDTTQGALDDPAKILDSLPVGDVAAVHLETDCGDCTSRVILTSHRGWIARIEASTSDQEGYHPALTAHLDALARSFRWRR